MKLDLDKPFFDCLKEGVEYIETTVRSLKQESENGFPTLNEPLTEDEIQRINHFDDSVKETFADVSTLFNLLMKHPFNLDELDKNVEQLKGKLIQYETNSGFKEFGYKPFVYITPEKRKPSPLSSSSSSTTFNGSGNGSDNHDETIKPSLVNLSKDKESDKSKLLRSTFKVTGRKNVDNKRKSIIEAGKMPVAHINLPSNLSSQDGKRYPLIPSSHHLTSPNDDSQDGISIKYITGCKLSTGIGGGADSTSSSFTNNSVTDSSISNKFDASEVLVEFTPGLTTTRPKVKSRLNGANLRPPSDYRPGKFGHLRSSSEDSRIDSTPVNNNNRTFLKKTRTTTPESPVFPWSTAANKIKNSHNTYRISPEPRANLRTLDKSTPEEPKSPSEITAIKKPIPGTPEMPSCTIDTALHQRLLAKAKTLRDNVF